jgi:hypothetical protein
VTSWLLVLVLSSSRITLAIAGVVQMPAFPTQEACAEHAARVAPLLERDLQTRVRWTCVPEAL